MKKTLFTAAITSVLLICGCSSDKGPQITQVSTMDSLVSGIYKGSVSVEQMREYGDLGLGTATPLDGEMIILDGMFYHIYSDGKAYILPEDRTIPFGEIVKFKAEKKETIGEMSMDELLKKIDQMHPNQNGMAVFKMNGTFSKIKVRTMPRQKAPYRPYAEIVDQQIVFDFENVEGWLIGFRFPGYMKGLNLPGWHLHFLRKDRTSGGHVMDFQTKSGKLESTAVYDFHMILPENSKEFQETDFSKDRSADAKKAEAVR